MVLQSEIAGDRLTAEQRGLLHYAFAFRQRCGDDYYSSRLLSHFLLHCDSRLKVAQEKKEDAARFGLPGESSRVLFVFPLFVAETIFRLCANVLFCELLWLVKLAQFLFACRRSTQGVPHVLRIACPRCGAHWAGVDGLTNGAIVCFDCLARPAGHSDPGLNRTVLAATAGVALAACFVTFALSLPRRMPSVTAAGDELTEVANAPIADAVDPPRTEPVRHLPQAQPAVGPKETSIRVEEAEKPWDDALGIPLPPPPDKRKDAPPPAEKQVVTRTPVTESMLLQELATAPEVGLGTTGQTVLSGYVAAIQDGVQRLGTPRLADPSPLIQVRPNLLGLPLRTGASCQLNATAAADLGTLSRKFRMYLNATAAADGSPRPETAVDLLRQALEAERRGQRPEWLRPEAVPTLLQMLMPEEPPVRKLLVDLLAEIPHASTTTALAQRAVFDLDAEVRKAAVTALRKRPAEVYRPVLLRALRYPWSFVADNAAAALVELGDMAAIPHLVTMLRQPDPTAPETLPSGARSCMKWCASTI